jgi:hypothetical protein
MEDERHIKEEHHIRKEHQTRDIMEEEHHMIHIEDHHMDIYICMESELWRRRSIGGRSFSGRRRIVDDKIIIKRRKSIHGRSIEI